MREVLRKANLYRRYSHWRRAGCVFIHVPKAAGTSINHALYGRTLGHYTALEVRNAFPRLFNNAYVFSVVRNPYDRLLSAYRFARLGRTADMGMYRPERYQTSEFRTFESFVFEWLIKQDMSVVDPVFRAQSEYVTIDGVLAVDGLFRFESLEEGMTQVQLRLGRELNLARRNAAGQSVEYRQLYSRPVRDVVRELYSQDFATLGYDDDL